MAEKKDKTGDLPNILTLKQAADVLNVHPNTLRNWDNQGVLKAVRYGKRGDRRYKREDVLKILQSEK